MWMKVFVEPTYDTSEELFTWNNCMYVLQEWFSLSRRVVK